MEISNSWWWGRRTQSCLSKRIILMKKVNLKRMLNPLFSRSSQVKWGTYIMYLRMDRFNNLLAKLQGHQNHLQVPGSTCTVWQCHMWATCARPDFFLNPLGKNRFLRRVERFWCHWFPYWGRCLLFAVRSYKFSGIWKFHIHIPFQNNYPITTNGIINKWHDEKLGFISILEKKV